MHPRVDAPGIPLSGLFSSLVPIALIVAVGALAGRTLHLDVRALSKLTLYVLTPALIGYNMYTASLPLGRALGIVMGFILATALLYGVALGTGHALRYSATARRSLIATTIFPNMGNMGLPLVFFALGQDGFDLAIVLFVTSAFLVFGFGPALVQSRGAMAGVRTAIRLPLVWALIAGVALRVSGVSFPLRLDEGIDLLGRAAVPILLLILGMQMAKQLFRLEPFVLVSSLLRLVGGPLIAFSAATVLNLPALELQVLTLQLATPTAVNAMLIASEFGGDAERTARVVVASTLLAFATLPGVLWFLAMLP